MKLVFTALYVQNTLMFKASDCDSVVPLASVASLIEMEYTSCPETHLIAWRKEIIQGMEMAQQLRAPALHAEAFLSVPSTHSGPPLSLSSV